MVTGKRERASHDSRTVARRTKGTPYLMKASPHLALSPSSPSHYLVTLAFLEVAKRRVLGPLFTWSWGASLAFVSSELSPHLSLSQRLLFQPPLPTESLCPSSQPSLGHLYFLSSTKLLYTQDA